MRWSRWTVASAVAVLVGCASAPDGGPRAKAGAPTPCEEVIPGCQAERLVNVTLQADEKDGALGPVTGPVEDVISFDEALAAAGREDGHPDAETVQVVLGSADAKALHWDSLCDSACDLFYAITWGGVCSLPLGGGRPGASPQPTGCLPSDWGTVIDAHTGTFIVGGG